MLAIPVWRYHKQNDWFRDLVARCIVYFTGFDATHVGLYFQGKLYESTIWRNAAGKLRTGIRITEKRDLSIYPPDLCLVPWRLEITQERIDRIAATLEQYVAADRPYNIFKLVILSVVWPTRWVWKRIKWVPFDRDAFGEVCSGFVDEVMMKSRWDLFPDEWEGYSVPGQFLSIPGWRMERCGSV